jgi:hypothetical protein
MVQTGEAKSSDGSLPQATPPSSGGGAHKNEKLRVYNRSEESFLSLEVAIFDTTAEPLKRLFEFLVTGADRSLWLKPYRGIPATQGAKSFDLVYLDAECRVIQEADHYPNPQFTVLSQEPGSALLMPAHTVFASQIHVGDQLAICGVAELEGILTDLSNSTDGDSGTQDQSIAEPSSSNSGSIRMPHQAAHQKPNARETESEGEKKSSWGARIQRWFFPEAQSDNRSFRRALPGLIAYHWSGGTPQPYPLGNISETGFYLLTDERPYPGTLIMMTLQRTGTGGEKLEESIAVYTKVIRWGPDGVGFAFVAPEVKDIKRTDHQPGELADQESLQRFLRIALVRETERTR